MTDLLREKYLRLMSRIEELEEQVADLEQEQEVAKDSPDAKEMEVVIGELAARRTELAAKRNELARLSDGCGKPHPM